MQTERGRTGDGVGQRGVMKVGSWIASLNSFAFLMPHKTQTIKSI